MNDLLGFPDKSSYRFRIDGRRYRVNPDGAAALEILQRIYHARGAAQNYRWALPLREDIRRLQHLNVRSVLVHVINQTSDERMRLIAIWLRGRCGGYLGAKAIARTARTANFLTQKECVRALKRMSGWSQLREIATYSMHERVRLLATQRPARALPTRLAEVTEHLRPTQTGPRTNPFWMQPGLNFKNTAPRTATMIRAVLHRIQRLIQQPKSAGVDLKQPTD